MSNPTCQWQGCGKLATTLCSGPLPGERNWACDEHKEGCGVTPIKEVSEADVTKKLSNSLRDRWVEARRVLNEPLPLILYEEVYEHFGEWCKIIQANVYDEDVRNAEVVIENRSGHRHSLEFRELSWRKNYDMMSAHSEKSIIEIIVEGFPL